MGLLHLPEEILVHILHFLAADDLLNCRKVSHHVCKIVDSYAQLQYTIQLRFDGLVDTGPLPGALSYAERLQHLHARQRAWERLQWRRRFQVPMPQDCQTYELVGGLYVQSRTHQDLTILRLPTADDAAPAAPRNVDLNVFSRDFAMDPSQDLIVHLDDRPDTLAHHIQHRTIKLHLRTLSTNEEHPLSRKPVFAIPVPQHVLLASISMQIVNDVVGLFITNGFWQPRLVAWNWKRGQTLFDMHADRIPRNAAGFSFLSDTALAIPFTSGDGGFNLYTFDPNPAEDPLADDSSMASPSSAVSSASAWSASASATSSSASASGTSASASAASSTSSPAPPTAPPSLPTLRATLCLPSLHPGARATHILMHADPFMKGDAGGEGSAGNGVEGEGGADGEGEGAAYSEFGGAGAACGGDHLSAASTAAASLYVPAASSSYATAASPSSATPASSSASALASSSVSTPGTSPSACLAAAPEALLHVVTIGYEGADAEVRHFNLFVHNRTFLGLLAEGVAVGRMGTGEGGGYDGGEGRGEAGGSGGVPRVFGTDAQEMLGGAETRARAEYESQRGAGAPPESGQTSVGQGSSGPLLGLADAGVHALIASAQDEIERDRSPARDGGAAYLTWEEWGPGRTRMVPEVIPSILLRYVHGGRAGHPQRIVAQDGRERNFISILDFSVRAPPGTPRPRLHPERGRSALCRATEREDSTDAPHVDADGSRTSDDEGTSLETLASGDVVTSVHTQPSVINDPELFEGTVRTWLPYRRSVRAVEEEFHALELDQHRIVGLRRDVGDLTVFAF